MGYDYAKDLFASGSEKVKMVSGHDYAKDLFSGVSEKETPPPPEQGFVSKTISNIPGSAYRLGEGIYGMVRHPIESAKAIGKTAIGGAQLLGDVVIPESARLIQPEDYRPHARTMGKFFSERYGGAENIKKTISEDPVGTLVDASALMTGGGTLAAKTGIQAGATVAKAGQMLEPISAATKAARLIPAKVPQKMYESAAKFSTTFTPKERTRLAQTALEYEIMPTYKGVEKAQAAISELNTRIDDMINSISQRGGSLPVDDLFKEWPKLLADASLSGKPIANQKLIQGIRTQIEDANLAAGRYDLTANQLQSLKKRIYRDLESFYDKAKNAPAAVDAQKSVARAAKEAIEGLVPEVKQLNAKEGALIELRDAIERSAARIKNRDIMGIGVPIKIGSGGAIGGMAAGGAGATVGGSLGLLWGVIDTPIVKSKLAIAINNLRKKGIKIEPSDTLKRLGIYEAGAVGRETREKP